MNEYDCFNNGGALFSIQEQTLAPWTSLISDFTDPSGPYAYPTHALQWSNGLA